MALRRRTDTFALQARKERRDGDRRAADDLMMLDHYSQTKCLLVSYDPNPMGFF